LVKEATTRINVFVSKRMNDDLDKLSSIYGVPKSSIAAIGIGQYVQAMMKQQELIYGHEGLIEQVTKNIKEEVIKNVINQA
jgi:hypothetical protein